MSVSQPKRRELRHRENDGGPAPITNPRRNQARDPLPSGPFMEWATKRRKASSKIRLLRLALAATGITFLIAGCPSESEDPSASRPTSSVPTTSLFAVGDTGSPWGLAPQLFEGQLAVGVAMQRAHERRPIDAFILLGDNFYPNGLIAKELLPRIAENVARPYCAFVDPSPELAVHLEDACIKSEQPRPKIFAVIGNHDLTAPGSHDLQRNTIPRFVQNWEMPAADGPAIRELPGGLSLIFLNSDYPWGDLETQRLTLALENAQGPWRVIVGHRPPIAGHPQLSQMIAQAAERSDRIVHAYLAGHVHVLAAIRGALPAPALTVIAGSGSHAERQDTTEYRIEGADVILEALGFARLDVMAESTPARLEVTLFQTPQSAALAFLGTSTIAHYEIDLDGSIARTD